MDNLSKKRYGLVRSIVLSVILNMWFVLPAFANSVDFTQTTLYTGTVNLIWAAVAAMTAITVAVTVVLSIKAGLAWQVANDQEKPQKKKELINTIVIGVIVASLTGVITIILGAYGLSDGTGGSNIASINSIYQLARSINYYQLI